MNWLTRRFFVTLRVSSTRHNLDKDPTWHEERFNILRISRIWVNHSHTFIRVDGQEFPVHPDDEEKLD